MYKESQSLKWGDCPLKFITILRSMQKVGSFLFWTGDSIEALEQWVTTSPVARFAARLARSARVDQLARSHSYRGARAQAGIRYTVYGICYTLYRLWAGWSRESLDKACADRCARSFDFTPLATENIHGRCSCHCEACAVFYLRPSSVAHSAAYFAF